MNPEAGADAIKPGMQVNMPTQTSEEYEGDPDEEHPSHHHFTNWMSSEYAPHDSDSGDHNAVLLKALHYLSNHHPDDLANHEFHAHHMAKMFHGGHEFDETQHDLIGQGNHDVGGDAGDDFVSDVVDHDYERAQRESVREADDELLKKMRMIAGL
jgi:hypothetical protein